MDEGGRDSSAPVKNQQRLVAGKLKTRIDWILNINFHSFERKLSGQAAGRRITSCQGFIGQ